jgi:hypothetical protein
VSARERRYNAIYINIHIYTCMHIYLYICIHIYILPRICTYLKYIYIYILGVDQDIVSAREGRYNAVFHYIDMDIYTYTYINKHIFMYLIYFIHLHLYFKYIFMYTYT